MRFILDIASKNNKTTTEEIKQIQQNIVDVITPISGIITITCIDESNDSQFMTDEADNVLTKKQIEKYHRIITGYNLIFDTDEYGIVKVRPCVIDRGYSLAEGVSILIKEEDKLLEFITDDYELLIDMSNNEFQNWLNINKTIKTL